MNQQSVRERLQKYLIESGIKQRKIAETIQLDGSVLSQFKHGKKELWLSSLEALDAYLTSHNY